MNILIVTQVFYPENFIINNLCKFLVDNGHSITVVTGKPNYPQGKFYKNYGLDENNDSIIKGDIVKKIAKPKGIKELIKLYAFCNKNKLRNN